MNDLAIVVPLYQSKLTASEQVSWRHLGHWLGYQDVILVVPQDWNSNILGARWKKFAKHHFDSIASYSRLLLTREFYEQFQEFEYILFYQLDCLVLSSDLTSWYAQEWDYVGAPLFASNKDPDLEFSRVGNGGLSLRNVDASLRVLTSNKTPNVRFLWSDMMPDVPLTNIKKRLQVIRAAQRGVDRYAGNYSLNEDLFWSDRARLFDPSFSIAPVRMGLKFSFDAHPRYCFKQNKNRLPFGAHAWTRWDRSFWEPYLLP